MSSLGGYLCRLHEQLGSKGSIARIKSSELFPI